MKSYLIELIKSPWILDNPRTIIFVHIGLTRILLAICLMDKFHDIDQTK